MESQLFPTETKDLYGYKILNLKHDIDFENDDLCTPCLTYLFEKFFKEYFNTECSNFTQTGYDINKWFVENYNISAHEIRNKFHTDFTGLESYDYKALFSSIEIFNFDFDMMKSFLSIFVKEPLRLDFCFECTKIAFTNKAKSYICARYQIGGKYTYHLYDWNNWFIDHTGYSPYNDDLLKVPFGKFSFGKSRKDNKNIRESMFPKPVYEQIYDTDLFLDKNNYRYTATSIAGFHCFDSMIQCITENHYHRGCLDFYSNEDYYKKTAQNVPRSVIVKVQAKGLTIKAEKGFIAENIQIVGIYSDASSEIRESLAKRLGYVKIETIEELFGLPEGMESISSIVKRISENLSMPEQYDQLTYNKRIAYISTPRVDGANWAKEMGLISRNNTQKLLEYEKTKALKDYWAIFNKIIGKNVFKVEFDNPHIADMWKYDIETFKTNAYKMLDALNTKNPFNKLSDKDDQ